MKFKKLDALSRGYYSMNDFQIGIIQDCLAKQTGGLSVPMGAGKTLIGLTLALQQTHNTFDHFFKMYTSVKQAYDSAQTADNFTRLKTAEHALAQGRVIFVCSKTLITNVTVEIKKFFGDSLLYEILHNDYCKTETWVPKINTRLIIITPQFLVRPYVSSVKSRFIYYTERQVGHLTIQIKNFHVPKEPWLDIYLGLANLYSVKWGCLVVDEAANFVNIEVDTCCCICALVANHRWLMSGTLFREPKDTHIFGYYMLINDPSVPRNLPDFSNYLHSEIYTGYANSTVYRERNMAFTPPEVKYEIVSHTFDRNEEVIFTMIKFVLAEIHSTVQRLRREGDNIGARQFSTFLMPTVGFLRQGLIAPLLPISSAVIDMFDYEQRSELSSIMVRHLNNLELDEWLNNPESAKSSRIKKVLETLNKHQHEKCLVFSCFRTGLDLLESYISGRPIFTISGSCSVNRRYQILDEFSQSENGVLLLTYKIGGVGLNLQCSSVVLLMDLWWNEAETMQAIARVVRMGQQALRVHVYFFTCNTLLEKTLFEKQDAKKMIIQQLMNGQSNVEIPKINTNQIVELVARDINVRLIQKLLER